MSNDEIFNTCAKAYSILALNGHADGTLGHISFRDPGDRGFWMKTSDIGMDEVEGRGDFVLLSFEGDLLAGEGGVHSEWPIHAEILRADSRLQSVIHTHAPNSALLSATNSTVSALTPAGGYFALSPVRVMCPPSAQIDSSDEAREVAAFMGGSPVILLKNHGLIAAGESIEAVTLMALYVERAAAVQLTSLSCGDIFTPASKQVSSGRARMFLSEKFIKKTFEYYVRSIGRSRTVAVPSF